MYEATFRIEGESAYAGATRDTDTVVELWCNDHCDLLHVRGAGEEAVLEHVRSLVGVQDLLWDEEELLVVTDDCLKRHEEHNVERYLARHGCLLVPPLSYADGAKTCRVLALDPANLTALYRDLAGEFSVDVESKREIDAVTQNRPLLTLETALPELSPRQREALGVAHELGYYRIPRETTTAAIAERLGVERRTAEEHLRRAENKLVEALGTRLYG